MANLTVKIHGLEEMRKKFNSSPAKFVTTFDRAIKSAVFILLATSRQHTPVDTNYLRGVGMETEFHPLIGKIENKAPYAIYVHEGTRFMDARPFFEEGIQAGQSRVDAVFRQAINTFTNAM